MRMHPFPVAFPGMSEFLPKVDLNLILSKRLIIKMGVEKAGSSMIPDSRRFASRPRGERKSLDVDGLTPARWMPGAGSPLRSPPKAHAQQNLGAGPCFGAAAGPGTGEENKAPREKMSVGAPRICLGGVSCALNTGLENGFSRLQGALEEVQVSIPCKALLTLDLPVKNLGGGS